MTPLFLLQADFDGLRDLSDRSRMLANISGRTSIIDGHYYYDLGGDSGARFQYDTRIPLDKKVFTIEGWINSAVSTSAVNEFIFGGLGVDYNNGFYVGFVGDGFLLATGSGSRDRNAYGSFPVNQAVHFAWVMDGIRKKLYINGVKVLDAPITTGITKSPSMTFAGGGGGIYDTIDTSPSFSKVHQLILWDDVRYTQNFTPEYIEYEQQQSYASEQLASGSVTRAGFDGVIADRVLIKGAPTERKVVLYRRGDDKLIGKTWSDKAGNYRFENLDRSVEYYVLSIDHTRNYNAVIQDMIRTDA